MGSGRRLLPEMRIEANRPARVSFRIDDLRTNAAPWSGGRIAAGLRRHGPEAGDDRLSNGPHMCSSSSLGAATGLTRSVARRRADRPSSPPLAPRRIMGGPIAMRPPNEWPTTTGGPAAWAPASRPLRAPRERTGGGRRRTAVQTALPVKDAPPHAAPREEQRDQAPPVGRGRAAVEGATRLAALAPGQGLDLSALHGDERPLGLDGDSALEPWRRRRPLPTKGRKRRRRVGCGHAGAR